MISLTLATFSHIRTTFIHFTQFSVVTVRLLALDCTLLINNTNIHICLSTMTSQVLRRLRNASSGVELVYIPHERWPLPSNATSAAVVRLSCLDSSFNPPTLAHEKLMQHGNTFDARLLILSVTNVDKTLKASDASYEQRLEMMVDLAKSATDANVAVALMDEPTFVGKSRKLKAFLRERGIQELKLSFLMGFDTLVRLFAPRYYSDAAGQEGNGVKNAMYRALHGFFAEDDSSVICASRDKSSYPASNTDSEGLVEEQVGEFLSEYKLEADKVQWIDIGQSISEISSSSVRDAVCEGREWNTLVPECIKRYIENSGLYVSSTK